MLYSRGGDEVLCVCLYTVPIETGECGSVRLIWMTDAEMHMHDKAVFYRDYAGIISSLELKRRV